MKKLNIFLLFIFLIPTLYFSSCSKDDGNDDLDAPSIWYAKINMHDTIYTSEGKLIILNDSTRVEHQIDTVVIGKWLFIDAAFWDEGKLSSFKVETNLRYKYNGDALENPEMYKDSILKIMRRGNNIYNKDTAFVYGNRLVKISDSIARNYNGKSVSLKLVEGDYDTKVVCMDIAGNKDSIEFPVRYLLRSSVIKGKN